MDSISTSFTDNNTTYSVGAGLNLADTTFSIADGGVTNQMLEGSIKVSKLSSSNTPTVGQLPSYDNTTGGITWITASGTGTVTQIDSGNGLSGGPITTTGSIAINAPTCSGSEKLSWNGTAFICSSDVDTDTDTNNYPSSVAVTGTTTKTITLGRQGLTDLTATFQDLGTTYSAGAGLSLSGTTFSILDNYDDNFLTTATSFGGDVSGTVGAMAVADNSHNHDTSTISGLDISSDTNLSGDTEIVLTGDALSIAGAMTRDSEWNTVAKIETATSSNILTSGENNSLLTNDSGYITPSSSSALTNKTGNISQWTNDSAYITDGNTNWDNSYGFITDGNTGWDNSYGFITGVNYSEIANGSGVYLNYKPNNTACGEGQVLKYDATNNRWACGNDSGGTSDNNYPTSIAFSGTTTKTLTLQRQGLADLTATFTDIDTDTNTTYSAGSGLSLAGTVFSVADSYGDNFLITTTNFGGDVSGTYGAIAVTDDSHNHTSSTISGLDISSDTNLAGDTEIVLTGDALSIASSMTRDTEIANFITDGNTGWDNSYGFITDGNTGWDNSYGLITGVNFSEIANGAGVYLNYKPNNTACGLNQVLKYDNVNNRWGCADDTDTDTDTNNYPSSISFSGTTTKTLTLQRQGLVDLTATFTDIDTDTNTTYSAGSGLDLTGTTFSIPTGGVSNTMLTGNIAASKLVGTDIATVGTITAGTWSGTTITFGKGGTGLTSLGTANQIMGVDAGGTGLEYKTLTAGSNVTITPGAGSITISSTGGSGSQTPWTSNISAAGYTLYGNSTSGGSLLLDSTSHATKGNVILQPAGGNVGIGTTAPTSLLSINNPTASTDAINVVGNTAGENIVTIGQGANRVGVMALKYTGSTKIFLTSRGNSYFIGGNVGVGTTDLTSLFQVSQQTSGVGTVSNSAGGTTVTGVGTQFTNTFKIGDTITVNSETRTIATVVSDTSLTTDTWTGANSGKAYTLAGGARLSVMGNGNVGVGTTAPAYKVDAGGGSAGNDIRGYDVYTHDGSVHSFSDSRLKEVTGAYSSGLKQITALNPIFYKYKPGNPLNLSSDATVIGLVAQDLQKVIPEAVATGQNGYLTVTQGPIIYAMINAIKEENLQVESITTRLTSLEEKVSALGGSALGGESATLRVEGIDTRLASVETTSEGYSAELAQLEERLKELEAQEQASSSPEMRGGGSDASSETEGLNAEGLNSGDDTRSSTSTPSVFDHSPSSPGEKSLEELKNYIDAQLLALDLSAKLQGDIVTNLNLKNLTVISDATFAGDLKIEGHIVVGGDTAGKIVIPVGETEVKVIFEREYLEEPIVTATLVGKRDLLQENLKYLLTDKTTAGFVMAIDKPYGFDVEFDWHAFGR